MPLSDRALQRGRARQHPLRKALAILRARRARAESYPGAELVSDAIALHGSLFKGIDIWRNCALSCGISIEIFDCACNAERVVCRTVIGSELVGHRTEKSSTGHESEVGATSRPTQVVRLLSIGAIVFVLVRILAVDIAGIVTNDSLGYLGRADAPFSHGFLASGYRQAGYPVFLAFSNQVGDVLGWDHIFGVALLQRSMLILSILGLIWAARWRSFPGVLVATSANYVLLADFVLTEGVILPCCIASGALLTATTYGRVRSPSTALAVLIGSALLAAFAGALKLQFASLLAVSAAIAWILVRDAVCSLRAALLTVTIATLLIFGLAGAQAIENHQDLGTFEPIAERHRSMWWGAWQAVFEMQPENGEDPDLAEFFDEGNLYTFLHGIDRDVEDYGTRQELTIERTEAMFEAAGTSVWRERLDSFVGALRGGRSDDLSGITQRTLALEPGDAESRITSNSLASSDGADVVIVRLNDDARPGVVTTGPLLDWSQSVFDDYRTWTRWLAPIALLALFAAALFGRRERPAAIGVLTMFTFCAAAMASGFTDNARYLIGPLTVVLIAGTNAVREFVLDERPRPWRRPIRGDELSMSTASRVGAPAEGETQPNDQDVVRPDAPAATSDEPSAPEPGSTGETRPTMDTQTD